MTTSVIANDLALLPILIGGTEEQKAKFVQPFTEELRFTSFALTEPNAGSDVAGMSTTITDDGDSYVINGSKMWITNGTHAEQFTLFGKTDPKAVTKESPVSSCQEMLRVSQGVSQRRRWARTLQIPSAYLRGCACPANLIGEEGQGQNRDENTRCIPAAHRFLRSWRCAKSHGALRGLRTREKLLGNPSPISGCAVHDRRNGRKNSCRKICTYQCAWMVDNELRSSVVSSYAKALAADFAMEVTTDAVQIFGGYGYSKSIP